nr:HipA domain-containing protein [Tatumella citrea]
MHQEQLDGAMAVPDKYGLNEQSEHTVSYERAAKFVAGYVDSSLAGKRDIFLRILCAYLFGNNDFHLRNIGLLYSPQGRVSIAPVYDFVSVVPYPSSFTEVLALPLLEPEERNQGIARGLDSYLGEYTGYDFIELAEGMGIKPRLAEKYITSVTVQRDRILSIIESSYMRNQHKSDISAYIRRRVTLLNTFTLD